MRNVRIYLDEDNTVCVGDEDGQVFYRFMPYAQAATPDLALQQIVATEFMYDIQAFTRWLAGLDTDPPIWGQLTASLN
jgi:hypothetical protein